MESRTGIRRAGLWSCCLSWCFWACDFALSHSAVGLSLSCSGAGSGRRDGRERAGPTLCCLLHTPSQVNVSVHNRLELRNSSNVLGIIRGAVEPGERPLGAPCVPRTRPSLRAPDHAPPPPRLADLPASLVSDSLLRQTATCCTETTATAGCTAPWTPAVALLSSWSSPASWAPC